MSNIGKIGHITHNRIIDLVKRELGYRVNSIQATHFRIWATKILKEFIIKGFVLDDERLKQGQLFGKDYFDELPDRQQPKLLHIVPMLQNQIWDCKLGKIHLPVKS